MQMHQKQGFEIPPIFECLPQPFMTIPVNPPPTPHYELSSLDAEGRWPQNANDSTVAVIPRWHPKMTGSRLFTMLTTLALGTAKAVITYREADAIVVPVTLEWITSTIIFIMQVSPPPS
ncbi:hypothetical protein BKA70DRAFT_728227 [Coprinopsis sp. MPI-PUGE-AT-0042]|nr:hypothetical protein BKA70DRAFT_728227 [Coprinopsis sp. MPI-PUGE-AT-0042]